MITLQELCSKGADKIRHQRSECADQAIQIARDLLCICLNFTKVDLIKSENTSADATIAHNFEGYISRFIAYEPISRIIGLKNFYNFDFIINQYTLDPRPETELLINMVREVYTEPEKPLKILDIGTGSGCLAVTLARLYRKSLITALDICENALIIAQENASRAAVQHQIDFVLVGKNLDYVASSAFDVIVCNPPYIPNGAKAYLDLSVTQYDPSIALFFGDDGLGFYNLLADFSVINLSNNGDIFIEYGIGQTKCIKEIFQSRSFENFHAIKDHNGIFRSAKISY